MDFDLSLIDQVGVHKASSQPPRSSKFAPRAAARPKPKPLESSQQNLDERQGGQDNSLEKQSQHEEASLEEAAALSGPSHLFKKAELSRPLSGDPPPISDQPAENAQPTARGRSAATLRAEPPKAVQAQRDTGRLEGRTKTEGNREGVASTEAKDLAIVPFDPRIELEDEEQDGQLSSQETKRNWNTADRKHSKGGKREMTNQEIADRELIPAVHSIEDFVERARANERIKAAKDRKEAKKRKADELAESQGQEQAPAPRQPTVNPFVPHLEEVEGVITYDPQSLLVQAQPEQATTSVKQYENLVNNRSHSKHATSKKWDEMETNLFFMALQTYGTDFETLASIFPHRDRKMMVSKWRRESKLNPERCKEAMKNRGGAEGYAKIAATATGKTADGGELEPQDRVTAMDLFDTQLGDSETPNMEPLSDQPSRYSKQQSSASKSGGRSRGGRKGRGRGRESAAKSEAVESSGFAEGEASLEVVKSEEPQKKASRRKSVPVKSTPGDVFAEPATANGQEGKSGRGRGRPRKKPVRAGPGRPRKVVTKGEATSDSEKTDSPAPSSSSEDTEA